MSYNEVRKTQDNVIWQEKFLLNVNLNIGYGLRDTKSSTMKLGGEITRYLISYKFITKTLIKEITLIR